MARSLQLVGSSFALALLFVATPAAAAPPGAGPEEEACQGRSVGDACTLPNNQLGTCSNATCNRLDYSQGSPPKAIEEACVVCQPAGAGAGGHDGPPMLGGEGGSEPPEADSGASEGSSKETGKEPPESASRCRVDDSGGSPAGLAVFAGLLVLVRRRRSQGK